MTRTRYPSGISRCHPSASSRHLLPVYSFLDALVLYFNHAHKYHLLHFLLGSVHIRGVVSMRLMMISGEGYSDRQENQSTWRLSESLARERLKFDQFGEEDRGRQVLRWHHSWQSWEGRLSLRGSQSRTLRQEENRHWDRTM